MKLRDIKDISSVGARINICSCVWPYGFTIPRYSFRSSVTSSIDVTVEMLARELLRLPDFGMYMVGMTIDERKDRP